jgi:AraC-like DNA-binding protein/quercetin dioxygenase-like cupin family protein
MEELMSTNNYTFYKEQNIHGNSAYPFAIYNVKIPETFYSFPLHCHDEVEIIYVCKGKGIITINLKPYIITKGDIAFISPGILHSMEQFEKEPFIYRNIIFDLRMILTYTSDESTLETVLPLMSNKVYFPMLIDKKHSLHISITELLIHMQNIHDTKSPGYELAIKAYILLILYQFTSNNLLLSEINFSKSNTLKLKRILSYIKEHYLESISIQDAARFFGSSPSNFMRFFKNATGTSFIHYLNDYRLNLAKEQLLTTCNSILDIAINVGFNNLSYFNRMFKDKYHESPSSFRKKHSIIN